MRPGAGRRSPRSACAALLAGIERADSITIDAHKWFATTMGCGMFITARRRAALSRRFTPRRASCPRAWPSVDPYLNSVQWSRRFLGLRLFLALAAAGWRGLRRARRARGRGDRAHPRRLEARGWTVGQRFAARGARSCCRRRAATVRALVRQRAGLGPCLGGADAVRGAGRGAHLRHPRRDLAMRGCRRSWWRRSSSAAWLSVLLDQRLGSSAPIESSPA